MARAAALSSLPRPARWALGALVALPVVVYLVLLFFPWNTLREPIANYYSAKTGARW
jgi:hypothetical protein